MIQLVKGTKDIYGVEVKAWQEIEGKMRRLCETFGIGEIRTPAFEFTELFVRGVGETTDIVQKEMYTFTDDGDRSLTLRPEGTAGAVRAYIEHGMHNQAQPTKLYYISTTFRCENTQAGRQRQFHQFGIEILGSYSAAQDAEVISVATALLEEMGIKGVELRINSLGCPECRARYNRTLKEFIGKNLDKLCDTCKERFEKNPLRVLDCKQPGCRALTDNAPRLADYNCLDCKAHFETVLSMLRAEELPLELDHRLVRGLDYYCRTTFEVVSGSIGAQSAVAGGGRYDGLIRSLGGPDAPGVGVACGMERLALLLGDGAEQRPDFYLLGMEEGGRMQAFALAQKLRAAGLRGEMNFSAGGFKSLMRQAGKSGARCCLIIGPDEVARGDVSIKHLDSGEQRSLPQADAILYLKQTGTAND